MENIDPEALKRLEADIIATHREEIARRAKRREKQRELQLQAQEDIATSLDELVQEVRELRVAFVAIVKSNSGNRLPR